MEPQVTFPENWTPPAELSRAPPRAVRMASRGIVRAIFGVILMAAAAPLFVYTHRDVAAEEQRARVMREQGVTATGEVRRLWRQSSGRSSILMVQYAFTAGTRRVIGESSVAADKWGYVQKAGMIPIRYVPSDPTINHPAAWDVPVSPAWMPYVLALMPLAWGGVLLVLLRREQRLLQVGLPSAAVVTGSSRVKNGWAADYVFRAENQVVKRGRVTMRRDLAIGTILCVLYDPEKPSRNSIYSIDVYRVA